MNESLLLRVPGLCSGPREFQERFDSPTYVNLRWPTSATVMKKSSRPKRKAHGRKEKFTAKEKSSRQKRKAHGKREKLTEKEKSSRQKRKAHGKKEKLAAKLKTRGGS